MKTDRKLLRFMTVFAIVKSISTECFHGQVQLLSESLSTESQGLVQVCYKGRWVHICDDETTTWEAPEASTVCTQLGYSDQGASATSECLPLPMEDENRRFLRFFECNTSQADVTACYFDSRVMCNSDRCNTMHTGEGPLASVQCLNATCTNGEVRLTHGQTNREGRVEVCMNGRWRAMCRNEWTEREIGSLCEMLGHSSHGAEVRVFHPRAAPTLNCRVIGTQRSTDLECVPEGNCTQDLGILCLSQALPQLLTEDCERSAASLRGMVGFLVIVLVVLVIGWSLSCVALVKRKFITQKLDQFRKKQGSHNDKPTNIYQPEIKNPIPHTPTKTHTYESVQGESQTYAVPEICDSEKLTKTGSSGATGDEHYYHVLEAGQVYEVIKTQSEGEKTDCP